MISLQVQGTTEQGFQCKYQSTHCVSPAVAEKDKILQQNSLCTFPLHRIMQKHEILQKKQGWNQATT